MAEPAIPRCVAMLVQIGDHLSKQYDVKGGRKSAKRSVSSGDSLGFSARRALVFGSVFSSFFLFLLSLPFFFL